MEKPDPPSDTPGASKQVVLTPHDIPRILRVGNTSSFMVHFPASHVSWSSIPCKLYCPALLEGFVASAACDLPPDHCMIWTELVGELVHNDGRSAVAWIWWCNVICIYIYYIYLIYGKCTACSCVLELLQVQYPGWCMILCFQSHQVVTVKYSS